MPNSRVLSQDPKHANFTESIFNLFADSRCSVCDSLRYFRAHFPYSQPHLPCLVLQRLERQVIRLCMYCSRGTDTPSRSSIVAWDRDQPCATCGCQIRTFPGTDPCDTTPQYMPEATQSRLERTPRTSKRKEEVRQVALRPAPASSM